MRALCLLTLLALTGCLSDEERLAELERGDDVACRAQPSVPYDTCRALRIQYRTAETQQNAANLDAFGARLRNAGQALHSNQQFPQTIVVQQPPPRPVTCVTNGNMTTCN